MAGLGHHVRVPQQAPTGTWTHTHTKEPHPSMPEGETHQPSSLNSRGFTGPQALCTWPQLRSRFAGGGSLCSILFPRDFSSSKDEMSQSSSSASVH